MSKPKSQIELNIELLEENIKECEIDYNKYKDKNILDSIKTIINNIIYAKNRIPNTVETRVVLSNYIKNIVLPKLISVNNLEYSDIRYRTVEEQAVINNIHSIEILQDKKDPTALTIQIPSTVGYVQIK